MSTVFYHRRAGKAWLGGSFPLAAKKTYLALAGRDLSKVDNVAAQLRTRYGVNVSTLELDPASFNSIRACGHGDPQPNRSPRNRAIGSLALQRWSTVRGQISYSKDGFEEMFATNYLGHFLLVNLLLDCMTENGRVVFTASETHDPDAMHGKMVGPAVEPDAYALANQGKEGSRSLEVNGMPLRSSAPSSLHMNSTEDFAAHARILPQLHSLRG